jgi:pimeloyl-ACP methyl ester carboxylesterase
MPESGVIRLRVALRRPPAPLAGVAPLFALCLAAAPLFAQSAERFRMGSVDFAPCEIGKVRAAGIAGTMAQCAFLEVPENHDDPAGRHILLRVALVRSQAEPSEADVVTFLDGGPGQAATEDYPALAGEFSRIHRRRHILLVDQRGTGGSNALRCAAEGPGGGQEEVPVETASLRARQVRECLATLAPHAAVQFYSTSDAVRDLEAVRRALGIGQLDLVGVSYGTVVAQAYAKAYPAAVRAIVLDSPAPIAHALTSEHASNLEDVLRETFSRCDLQPGCRERYGDPYRQLQVLHEELRSSPRRVELADPRTALPVHRRLGADDLAGVVRIYAYNPQTRALLPFLLREAREGRGAPLLANSELLHDSLGGLVEGGAALSASVVCTEDADLLQGEAAQARTLLGTRFFDFAREVCPIWPHRARPAGFHDPLSGPVPTLVLSGEFDPVTPARYGAQIVRTLANARHFVLAGQGHSVMGAGCMPRLVAEFLERPSPAALDAACLKDLGDVPFLLDANGAAP